MKSSNFPDFSATSKFSDLLFLEEWEHCIQRETLELNITAQLTLNLSTQFNQLHNQQLRGHEKYKHLMN
jgi:hypothetical protein